MSFMLYDHKWVHTIHQTDWNWMSVCVGERLSGATFMHAHIEFDYATLGICTALIFCVA